MADAGSPPPNYAAIIAMTRDQIWQRYTRSLDGLVPHLIPRWVGLLLFLALYFLRVWMLQGFYIVTYALGIFLLNNFIGFITPQVGTFFLQFSGRGVAFCAAAPKRGRQWAQPFPPGPPYPLPHAHTHSSPACAPHCAAPAFAPLRRWTPSQRAPFCLDTRRMNPSPPLRLAWGSLSYGSSLWRA